jgi:hypothetical protein
MGRRRRGYSTVMSNPQSQSQGPNPSDQGQANMSEQAKTQLRQQFPDMSEDEMASVKSDPRAAAERIAARTGEDVDDIEKRLRQVNQA